MKTRISVTAAFFAVLLASPLFAQQGGEPYSIDAILVTQGPTIDGSLDDAVWQQGTLLDGFIQQEPDEGAPVSERTEVRILYDAQTLYLAVRAFDSEPDAITATEMRRDSDRLLDEDNFQIILDTFQDSRSAYMFVTNPLGAQLDQQVSNEGEGGRAGFGLASTNVNRDWDGVWHVEARQTADGWQAEIAIPLVTLRFPDAEPQSWGINFMRNIGRKNEQAYWTPIPKPYTITRVSLAGTINGLHSMDRGNDLRVTPFATTGGNRVREAGITDDDFQRDIGIDVKYGITAGLNLDLTINTDFAQAEVDDEQVNLTRFALFFPEKRDFFLENAGQFNVGSVASFRRLADLFFTRRIGLTAAGDNVPILGGARITGKIGRNDIAIMDVQTVDAFGFSGTNFLVARYGRNILTRSKIGALFINKEETNGGHFNRTYAIDATLAPLANLTAAAFLAKTETPGDFTDDHAGYLNVTWLSEGWRIYGEHADFGDDFNPEVGFLPRRGVRQSKVHVERSPRPDRWGIRSLTPMYSLTYTTDQTGRLVTRRHHFMNGTTFDNGAYLNMWVNFHTEVLDDPFTVSDGVAIAPGRYSFADWRLQFRSSPARRGYYELLYSPQDFFDGTRTDTQAKLGARLTNQFSAEASYARNDVSLPAGDFVVDLASFRLDYALSPTMTLRGITQYNSARDQWGTSARLRWTYKPGSDFYLAYDDVRRDPNDPTGLLQYRDRRVILKVAHLLAG
jgi:hypothetical protein